MTENLQERSRDCVEAVAITLVCLHREKRALDDWRSGWDGDDEVRGGPPAAYPWYEGGFEWTSPEHEWELSAEEYREEWRGRAREVLRVVEGLSA